MRSAVLVAAALEIVCGGTVFAGQTVTTNTSTGYVDAASVAPLVADFVRNECNAPLNGTSSGGALTDACTVRGEAAVLSTSAGELWDVGAFVPRVSSLPSGGWWNSSNETAFNNNIFSDQNGDGTLDSYYFNGIGMATNGSSGVNWTDIADAIAAPSLPLGAPTVASIADAVNVRDFWIDQVVVGYVVSKGDNAAWGGNENQMGDATEATTLIQNFRSQLGSIGVDPADYLTLVDQRLEQSVALSPTAAYEARLQVFQQAFGVASGYDDGSGYNGNVTTDPSINEGSLALSVAAGDPNGLAQMVSQDIMGYFFSCMNCDSLNVPTAHRFEPPYTPPDFIPWDPNWDHVPTIQHGPEEQH
ncbi:MAG: hypothetical protein ACE5FN_03210 [Leptospirillia bacterium]